MIGVFDKSQKTSSALNKANKCNGEIKGLALGIENEEQKRDQIRLPRLIFRMMSFSSSQRSLAGNWLAIFDRFVHNSKKTSSILNKANTCNGEIKGLALRSSLFASSYVSSFASFFVSAFVRSFVSSYVTSVGSSFVSSCCEFFCEIVCKFFL